MTLKEIKAILTSKIDFKFKKVLFNTRKQYAESIYPSICGFCYAMLKNNHSVLGIPVSENLVPRNASSFWAWKNNCIFFGIQTIMVEEPEMDNVELRRLIQSCVEDQIVTKGLYGLNSFYKSKVYGDVFSIWIEDVYYDEIYKYLNIVVLFVNSEDEARHVIEARNKDKCNEKTVGAIYDDEL